MKKLEHIASEHSIAVSRRGLPRLSAKLCGNEAVTAAFLGGSITEGAGASDQNTTCWRALTGFYLEQRFGEGKVTCINAGVGGTTSTFGAHRLEEHVLSKGDIDVLFVEFAVNDGKDREESIRGMEGIVRQTRRLSPRTDICFLYTAADKNLSEDVPFNIAVHEEVAVHYNIPSVNFAAGVYALMKSGRIRWEDIAPDRVHPNDEGYALYAGFLQHYLDQSLSDKEGKEPVEGMLPLPVPLIERSYEYGTMMDVGELNHPEGFQFRDLKSEPLMNWRFSTEHLYTDKHDASLQLALTGQGAGILLLCGPDSGIFEYSFDGLAFNRVNLFDDWCLKAFRPVIAMFPCPGASSSSSIIVRNREDKDERSSGTTLRILKILQN